MSVTDLQDRLLEVKTEIAEKCAQDSAFRSQLLADPNATVESEYGLEAGTLAALKLTPVVEEPGSIVLPIPPDMSEMELTDDQLDQVAGGSIWIGPCGPLGPIIPRLPRIPIPIPGGRIPRPW
jgi:hypothetical protein